MPEVLPIITIDGPSASGKGTVASRLARHLGFHFLDSGALYRLTAFAAQEQGIDWDDEVALVNVATQLDVIFSGELIILSGLDVSECIRSEAIGRGASQVAALPLVRTALLQRQRDFAQPPGLVADGRDMGSVVFPQAGLKIYLTASAAVRAQRRVLQLQARGVSADYADILHDLEQRDLRDQQRAVAPLQQAADAYLLCTDELSIDAAVQFVLDKLPLAWPLPEVQAAPASLR